MRPLSSNKGILQPAQTPSTSPRTSRTTSAPSIQEGASSTGSRLAKAKEKKGSSPPQAKPSMPWQRGVTQSPNAHSQSRQEVLDKSRALFSKNYDGNTPMFDFGERDVTTLSEKMDARLNEIATKEAKQSVMNALVEEEKIKNKDFRILKSLGDAIVDLGYKFNASELADTMKLFGKKINKDLNPILQDMNRMEGLSDSDSDVTVDEKNNQLENLRQEALKVISNAQRKYTKKTKNVTKVARKKVQRRINKNKEEDRKEITFHSQFIRNHNAFKLIDRDPNQLSIGTARLLHNQQATLKSLLKPPSQTAETD